MAIRINRLYALVAAAMLSCMLCFVAPAFADDQTSAGNDPVPTAPTDIATIDWSLSNTSYTYSGTAQRPKVIADGIAESDYTVSYSGNGVSAGTYTVVITGCGNYTGTKTLTYRIIPASVSKVTAKLSAKAYTYNGKVHKPSVRVTFGGHKLGKSDYSLKYSKGLKNAGTYRVTVKGARNFTGTKTLAYRINKAKVSKTKAKLSAKAYTYNGKVHKPSVRVTFGGHKLGKSDYSLKYSKGLKNAGTYKVIVKGKRNFSGTKTLKFRIAKAHISSAKLSHTKYYANGSAHKPGVTVKWHGKTLKKNRDFRVTYSGSGVSAGTYKVTIAGKGNYTGSKTLKYSVVKKAVKKKATHHASSNGSAASGGTCWITASGNGVAYHSTPNCRSLSRSTPVQTTVSHARSLGMHACPNCH